MSALHWVVTIFPVWFRSSAQSESFFLSERLMSTRMRFSRSSRTQSITALRRAAWYESGEIGPGPKRPVSLVKSAPVSR